MYASIVRRICRTALRQVNERDDDAFVGMCRDDVVHRFGGVHVVEMRWGKAVSIDANEDSPAVADLLRRQAAWGIEEALAAPILT